MSDTALLHHTATRLAGVAAAFFAMSHFIRGFLSGDAAQALHGVGPALGAILAAVMLWKRWYRADIVLITAVISTTILFRFAGEETSDPTLVSVALVVTAGALLMPDAWKWPYVWLSCLQLLTMTAYWNGISTETVWTGIAAALTAGSLMVLLIKLRDGISASHLRYQVLIERLPVPLIEQDWSRVDRWLDQLRTEGVTDIRSYMDTHPEELANAMRRIRVRGVNPAIVGLVGPGGLERGIDEHMTYGITHESMAPYVRQEIIGMWDGSGPLPDDYVLVRGNGDEFWARLEAANIIDGSIPGVDRVIVATDVTELKKTQEELGEQLRSKDEFIAAVSHELRTPLTSVLGFAELMQSNPEDLSPDQIEMLDHLLNQAKDMSHIVEDLLVAARAEIGAIVVDIHEFPLGSVVQQAVAESGDNFPIHGNQDLVAYGDRVRVAQIMRNLTTNANRYGGTERSVHISTDGECAVIEVRDNGDGIPLEHQERVFEPYVRAHDRPGMAASVGLGLTVSRQLAELMDGTVVYSRKDGTSIFRLALPLATVDA